MCLSVCMYLKLLNFTAADDWWQTLQGSCQRRIVLCVDMVQNMLLEEQLHLPNLTKYRVYKQCRLATYIHPTEYYFMQQNQGIISVG